MNISKLLATIQRASHAFRETPGRTGRFIRLPADAELMVGGDMHGSVENFRLLLKKADLGGQARRHLILQEVIHGPIRYPGGGDKSHQLLDLVAALKCQYPERVHFLLGNHELSQWQNQLIGKGDIDQNDLFRDGVNEAYGEWGEHIYAAYLDLFDAADLALVTANRVFISHSLPSSRKLPTFDLSKIEQTQFHPDDLRLGGAVHALVWGRDISQANAEAFLKKVDADWLITGHIPCPQGYLIPNDRQIILDCLGAPACYCCFPSDRGLTQSDLLTGIGTL